MRNRPENIHNDALSNIQKCENCRNLYRWFCIHCYCKSCLNLTFVDKVINLDLKSLDTLFYQYITGTYTDLFIYNDKSRAKRKVKNTKRQLKTVKCKELNLKNVELPNGIQNYNKYDRAVDNVLLKKAVSDFFKQRAYKHFYEHVKNIASYKECIEYNRCLYQRIYQVYVVSIKDNTEDTNSEDTNFDTLSIPETSTSNVINRKKKSLANKIFHPFQGLSKKKSLRSSLSKRSDSKSIVPKTKKGWFFKRRKRKYKNDSRAPSDNYTGLFIPDINITETDTVMPSISDAVSIDKTPKIVHSENMPQIANEQDTQSTTCEIKYNLPASATFTMENNTQNAPPADICIMKENFDSENTQNIVKKPIVAESYLKNKNENVYEKILSEIRNKNENMASDGTNMTENNVISHHCEIVQTTNKTEQHKNQDDNRISHIEMEQKSIFFSSDTPTAYTRKPIIPLKLGLEEIKKITIIFHESEMQLKSIIAKYIQDKTLENELYEAISCYGKCHLDAERRAHKLASDMWEEKSNITIANEKSQQKHLNILVQENRRLQAEIETMRSKYEKVLSASKVPLPKSQHGSTKDARAELIKNNDKLRYKIKLMSDQIFLLENELQSLQNQNESLVNQLNITNNQANRYKDLLQKSNTDHELEEASLSHQLAFNEQLIKDSVEAGDTLMDDIESAKRQLKSLPLSINWVKFKGKGNNLTDLIHLTRAWTNELSREIISAHSEITSQKKDNSFLTSEVSRLKDELNVVTNENDTLKSKMESLTSIEIEYKESIQKITILDSELEYYKTELTNKNQQLAEERNYAIISSENINALSKSLMDKEISINAMKSRLQDISNENINLRTQIENFQKLLDQSYISIIMKQLVEAQEKIIFYQTQYSELVAAKTNFTEATSKFTDEREMLLNSQQTFYEHLQQKQQDVEKLNNENFELKEKILSQRNELIVSNNEIDNQLGQNNIMKSVYTQLNCELLRSQALEASTLSMNFEANRLAVVAEHNDFISKQLQGVINSKDETISNLQHNIDKLNRMHQSNAEDKMALCQELTELRCARKQLHDELTHEQQRVRQLNETKDEIEKLADAKLQEMHQMLIEERSAIHELRNHNKNVHTQRNELVQQLEQYKAQAENLKSSESKLQILYDQTELKYAKLKEKCHVLEKNLQDTQRSNDMREVKTRGAIMELENKLLIRDNSIEKLRAERDELNNTIEYLQCTARKTHNELNEIREMEKERRDEVLKQKDLLYDQQKINYDQKILLDRSLNANKILEDKFYENEIKLDNITNEHNLILEEIQKREEKYKKELSTYEDINCESVKNIEVLLQDAKIRQKLLEDCKSNCENLKTQLENSKQSLIQMEQKYVDAKQNAVMKDKLQERLNNLTNEHELCSKKMEDYGNKMKIYNQKLAEIKSIRKNDLQFCKDFIDEITVSNKKHKAKMSSDLEHVSEQLLEFEQMHKNKCFKIRSLQINYNNVTEKLMDTVSKLMDEKIKSQSLKNHCLRLSESIAKYKSELEKHRIFIGQLVKKVQGIVEKTNIFQEIKYHLQSELECTRNAQLEAENQTFILENQLQETEFKLKQLRKETQILLDSNSKNYITEDMLENALINVEKGEVYIEY